MEVAGQPAKLTSPSAAIRRGISYITPDRQADGLCMGRSVRENISLAALRNFTEAAGVLRGKRERAEVSQVMDDVGVRAASPQVEVATLSGGNQQKVLFGKWVMTRPRVLLMEEPTRGVDVGAKTEIYRIMNELTTAGVAIVLVSSDLPELVAMSDRVLVMYAGRITGEPTGSQLTQQAVLERSLGVAA